MNKGTVIFTVIALMISTNLFAQIGRTYPDGHGGRMFFPFGDISFADKAISSLYKRFIWKASYWKSYF